jgi:hypothetical protein
MRTVTLAEFSSPAEAEALQKRLIEAGIRAELHTESKVEKMLNFFRATAGVRIEVPRDEFEPAFKLIYDWNTDQKNGGPAVSASESKLPRDQPDDNPWHPR